MALDHILVLSCVIALVLLCIFIVLFMLYVLLCRIFPSERFTKLKNEEVTVRIPLDKQPLDGDSPSRFFFKPTILIQAYEKEARCEDSTEIKRPESDITLNYKEDRKRFPSNESDNKNPETGLNSENKEMVLLLHHKDIAKNEYSVGERGITNYVSKDASNTSPNSCESNENDDEKPTKAYQDSNGSTHQSFASNSPMFLKVLATNLSGDDVLISSTTNCLKNIVPNSNYQKTTVETDNCSRKSPENDSTVEANLVSKNKNQADEKASDMSSGTCKSNKDKDSEKLKKLNEVASDSNFSFNSLLLQSIIIGSAKAMSYDSHDDSVSRVSNCPKKLEVVPNCPRKTADIAANEKFVTSPPLSLENSFEKAINHNSEENSISSDANFGSIKGCEKATSHSHNDSVSNVPRSFSSAPFQFQAYRFTKEAVPNYHSKNADIETIEKVGTSSSIFQENSCDKTMIHDSEDNSISNDGNCTKDMTYDSLNESVEIKNEEVTERIPLDKEPANNSPSRRFFKPTILIQENEKETRGQDNTEIQMPESNITLNSKENDKRVPSDASDNKNPETGLNSENKEMVFQLHHNDIVKNDYSVKENGIITNVDKDSSNTSSYSSESNENDDDKCTKAYQDSNGSVHQSFVSNSPMSPEAEATNLSGDEVLILCTTNCPRNIIPNSDHQKTTVHQETDDCSPISPTNDSAVEANFSKNRNQTDEKAPDMSFDICNSNKEDNEKLEKLNEFASESNLSSDPLLLQFIIIGGAKAMNYDSHDDSVSGVSNSLQKLEVFPNCLGKNADLTNNEKFGTSLSLSLENGCEKTRSHDSEDNSVSCKVNFGSDLALSQAIIKGCAKATNYDDSHNDSVSNVVPKSVSTPPFQFQAYGLPKEVESNCQGKKADVNVYSENFGNSSFLSQEKGYARRAVSLDFDGNSVSKLETWPLSHCASKKKLAVRCNEHLGAKSLHKLSDSRLERPWSSLGKQPVLVSFKAKKEARKSQEWKPAIICKENLQ